MGRGQLLVGVLSTVLAAVVRVGAGGSSEDGALYTVEELRVKAVVGEPEELVVGGLQDGAVDHLRFRL